MAREHRILSRLNQHFPLAPRSPLFCADPAIIGAPFLLIEYRDGLVIREKVPAALDGRLDAKTFSSRALDVLTRLHALEPAAVGLQDLGRPDGMVVRQARNWAKRADDAFGEGMPPALRDVAKWLSREPPRPQRVSILHSDFKFDNLIVSTHTAEPVALIDWDMGTLGDPLLDVATLLSYWVEPQDPPAMHALQQMPTASGGFPRRAEVLDLYARRTGTDMSEFKYYRVLCLFKLCVVFQQIHRRHRCGAMQDQRGATYGSLARGLAEFTESVLAHEHL
jgi:aminoglycoside phosphotransferase (APT) family kinase protein